MLLTVSPLLSSLSTYIFVSTWFCFASLASHSIPNPYKTQIYGKCFSIKKRNMFWSEKVFISTPFVFLRYQVWRHRTQARSGDWHRHKDQVDRRFRLRIRKRDNSFTWKKSAWQQRLEMMYRGFSVKFQQMASLWVTECSRSTSLNTK